MKQALSLILLSLLVSSSGCGHLFSSSKVAAQASGAEGQEKTIELPKPPGTASDAATDLAKIKEMASEAYQTTRTHQEALKILGHRAQDQEKLVTELDIAKVNHEKRLKDLEESSKTISDKLARHDSAIEAIRKVQAERPLFVTQAEIERLLKDVYGIDRSTKNQLKQLPEIYNRLLQTEQEVAKLKVVPAPTNEREAREARQRLSKVEGQLAVLEEAAKNLKQSVEVLQKDQDNLRQNLTAVRSSPEPSTDLVSQSLRRVTDELSALRRQVGTLVDRVEFVERKQSDLTVQVRKTAEKSLKRFSICRIPVGLAEYDVCDLHFKGNTFGPMYHYVWRLERASGHGRLYVWMKLWKPDLSGYCLTPAWELREVARDGEYLEYYGFNILEGKVVPARIRVQLSEFPPFDAASIRRAIETNWQGDEYALPRTQKPDSATVFRQGPRYPVTGAREYGRTRTNGGNP